MVVLDILVIADNSQVEHMSVRAFVVHIMEAARHNIEVAVLDKVTVLGKVVALGKEDAILVALGKEAAILVALGKEAAIHTIGVAAFSLLLLNPFWKL